MKLLIKTVQNLTGLTIDHFVKVSLLGFYGIAKALGPVQVCLNHAVKDPFSGVDLPAGVSTLNAQQALSFVRQRHGLPSAATSTARCASSTSSRPSCARCSPPASCSTRAS